MKAEGLARIAELLEPEGWTRRPEFSTPQVTGTQDHRHPGLQLDSEGQPVTVDPAPYADIVHADIEKTRRAITRAAVEQHRADQATVEPPRS